MAQQAKAQADFGTRVINAATQGAVGAVVGAALSSVTEPIGASLAAAAADADARGRRIEPAISDDRLTRLAPLPSQSTEVRFHASPTIATT